MKKTYEEINEKIRKGKAVVVTAEEMIGIVRDNGAKGAAARVDVVTTATFGPMCSSGVLLNTGHTKPRMNYKSAWLNGVPAYCGIAAVDMYLGATAIPDDDPANKVFPGEFAYGGGHVIEDLVAGRELVLEAVSHGSQCYPRRELCSKVTLKDLASATIFNPRNAYQNYNVAVNARGRKSVYTYLGILRPNMGNATFCSAGQLSPLLNDPEYRTIGLGTRIFLGGGTGHVVWHGTQHDPGVARNDRGVPKGGAGTIAVMGDLKGMSSKYLRGVSMTGYGVSLAVGIGVPIPVLDEEIARACSVSDADIVAPIVDYSEDYPNLSGEPLAHATYAELRSGSITVRGKRVETASLSSMPMAREIASLLKKRIAAGKFLLARPVELLPGPGEGVAFRPFAERPIRKKVSRAKTR